MRRDSKENWREVTKWTILANKWERVIQGKQNGAFADLTKAKHKVTFLRKFLRNTELATPLLGVLSHGR